MPCGLYSHGFLVRDVAAQCRLRKGGDSAGGGGQPLESHEYVHIRCVYVSNAEPALNPANIALNECGGAGGCVDKLNVDSDLQTNPIEGFELRELVAQNGRHVVLTANDTSSRPQEGVIVKVARDRSNARERPMCWPCSPLTTSRVCRAAST